MKTKYAFWIAGIGTLLATVLRCIQMLYFFDDETGFVTDSGVFALASGGLTLLTACVSGLLCRLDRGLCGRMRRGTNGAAGAAALFPALFLLLSASVLFRDFYTYHRFGVAYSIPAAHVDAHVPFAVLSVLFGLVMLASAVVWMRGKGLPGGFGALWTIGVLWGLCYMVLTFMTYSASATTAENLFTVGGGAALVFFLLAEGKLFSGIGGKNAAQDIYVFGLPAAVLWMTYGLSNTVLIVAGRGYATEMPYVIQLVMLLLSVHILTLLFTFRQTNFEPAQLERDTESREKTGHASQNAAKL